MEGTTNRQTIIRRLSEVPLDLIVVGLISLLTLVTTIVLDVGSGQLGTVLTTVFLVLIPGYALVAALFPTSDRSTTSSSGLGFRRRIGFSIGSSLVLASVIGVVVSQDFVRGEWLTMNTTLAALAIVFATVATVRRQALPENEQFGPSFVIRAKRLQTAFQPRTRTDIVVVTALVLTVLLVVSGAAYAMVLPPSASDGYTEFYLLSEDENGELTADNYPTTLTPGEERSLTVAIDNQENEAVTYTVVVQIQSVETDGDEIRVDDRTEIDRFSTGVDSGTTRHVEHTITPTTTGEGLRLTYLLYTGDPSSEPTEGNAYRSTYIWVDIEE